MNSKIKVIVASIASIVICLAGLFIYQVKKTHYYTPQTAEIIINDSDILKNAFMIYGESKPEFSLVENLTFASDVDKGTANLDTKQVVFGFYECDINRVFNEYNPNITYSSSNENIAKVDENGIITAFSKGETIITVKADNITLEVPIVVYKVVGVTELEQDIILLKGESKNLLTLAEYEIPLAEFYSSNEDIVTVNQKGTATAIAKGKAEVYTYIDKDKTQKISTKITVKQPIESVSVNNINIYTGQSAKAQVAYLPKNADYGTKFTYKIADTSIATISGNTVTGIKDGKTTLTVTSSNGVSAQSEITVKVPPRAKASVVKVSKEEYDSYGGEKYSDGSEYASYFKLSFDQPVIGFRVNYVTDNGSSKTTGSAIYNNASVSANSPIYFGICLNESDILVTRGFSYVNMDGSTKRCSLYLSGRDGSLISSEY